MLGVEQLGDEVVLGFGLPFDDRLVEIPEDAQHAALAPLGVMGELEHVTHPLGEGRRHAVGHAEDVTDDAHGNLLGVLGRGVTLTTLHDVGSQSATELAGEHLVLGHAGRAHGGQNEAARPGVQRRIGADGRDAR